MSVLPKYRNGRVCIPWWYGLGYPALWCIIGISIGMKAGDTMMDISVASALAMIVLAFIGSGFYFVFYGISKYREQKAQADELKAKIYASGRDPADPATLTASEKWDIEKCQKFDKIFIIADFLGAIIAAGLAVAVIYFYGIQAGRVPDEWTTVAVTAFIGGLIAAWIINETLVASAANGEWSRKASAAFRTVRPAIESAIKEGATRLDELAAKFMADGFSKKEARDLAKEVLVDEMKKA